jgi:hypothetical protein
VSARSAGRARWRRHLRGGAATCLALAPAAVHGQERLVAPRTVAVGASWEQVSFRGGGLAQLGFAGLDTTRVPSTTQWTLPMAASTTLAAGWRVDLSALLGAGHVPYRTASGTVRRASLLGVSDLRLRATGRFLHDDVVLTLGVNAPTGRTQLDRDEFSALRVLAAPALGLPSVPVGSGPSGLVGLVIARQVGRWSLAYGTSVEARGRFQPVAALVAGTGTPEFRPGGVVRASVGADRLLGRHRLSLAAAADIFADDRLRSSRAGDTAALPETRVRLGPVLSADAQLRIAAPALRELLAYGAYRWRAPFARDGRTVERSAGQYLDAGVRASRPLRPGLDALLSADGRWHSGLGIDQGLPTAGVASAGVTVGVEWSRALWSLRPWARGQVGTLRQRAPFQPATTQAFRGLGGGVIVVTRF